MRSTAERCYECGMALQESRCGPLRPSAREAPDDRVLGVGGGEQPGAGVEPAPTSVYHVRWLYAWGNACLTGEALVTIPPTAVSSDATGPLQNIGLRAYTHIDRTVLGGLMIKADATTSRVQGPAPPKNKLALH